jgi:hypothetical protein
VMSELIVGHDRPFTFIIVDLGTIYSVYAHQVTPNLIPSVPRC